MLEIRLKKIFKNFSLDVEMEIKEGEFVSIYGNSGSGKSTLLNLISGLVKPDSGIIKYDNTTWFDKEKRLNLKPQNREIGYLFQEHRIFPNMSVRQNIEFVLDKKNAYKNEVDELLLLTGLKKYEKLNAKKLSGGQKQRLALARAIVRKPKIFLLDEPLSSLDFEIKSMMRDKISEIHKIYKPTIIMVSHSIKEIVNVSDRIFFMENGKITMQKKIDDMKLLKYKNAVNCEIRDIVMSSL
jgi:molybdate transport system ATP-binding protein